MAKEAVISRQTKGWIEIHNGFDARVQKAKQNLAIYSKIPAESLDANVFDYTNPYPQNTRDITFDVKQEEMEEVLKKRPSIKKLFIDLGIANSDSVEVKLKFVNHVLKDLVFVPKEPTDSKVGVLFNQRVDVLGPSYYNPKAALDFMLYSKLGQDIFHNYNQAFNNKDLYMAQILISSYKWVQKLLGERVKA